MSRPVFCPLTYFNVSFLHFKHFNVSKCANRLQYFPWVFLHDTRITSG